MKNQKIRIFHNHNWSNLEKAINRWLKANDINISSTMQTEIEDNLTITIVYTEKFRE